MSSRIAVNVGVAAVSLLLSIGVVEVTLRYLADADGNLVVRGRRLGRQHLPIATTKQKIEEYVRDAGHRAYLIYDPSLGWAPRANATSTDGLYRYNAQTIRAPYDTAPSAPAGTTRVALFGDSFIHGDEVPFEDTIGAQVERRLRAVGLDVEVLNFGVPAYGTDQAFLRWRTLGRRFAPHIVIQGLFLENVERNMNVMRPLKSPRSGIPFSKPRFALQGETLVPINLPTLPPARIVGVLEDFSSSEYARYEHFYVPCGNEASFWRRSRTLDLLLATAMPQCGGSSFDWSVSGEPVRVAQRLFAQYAKEVREAGAAFLVLHIPDGGSLQRRLDDQRSERDRLVDVIAEQVEVISPEEALLDAARRADVRSLFGKTHYTRETNALVADAVAARLRVQLQ